MHVPAGPRALNARNGRTQERQLRNARPALHTVNSVDLLKNNIWNGEYYKRAYIWRIAVVGTSIVNLLNFPLIVKFSSTVLRFQLGSMEWGWMRVNKCEWGWMSVHECAWVWMSVTECKWVWMSVNECEWSVIKSEWVWMSVNECEWVWMSVRECWCQYLVFL